MTKVVIDTILMEVEANLIQSLSTFSLFFWGEFVKLFFLFWEAANEWHEERVCKGAIVRTSPPPHLERGGGIDLLKFGNKGEDKIFLLKKEGLD